MKTFTTLFVGFACFFAVASEVRWDCFALHEIGDGDSLGCYYYDSGRSSPEIGLRCIFGKDGTVNADGTGDSNIGWNVAIWVNAVAGDILNRSYFSLAHIVLKDSYNKNVPDPIMVNSIGNTLEVSKNDSFYLALIGNYYTDDGMPSDYYGWVELKNTGTELVIQRSAFSYGSIIVGGGETPEPSAVLLFLLGLVPLALRRPRNLALPHAAKRKGFGAASPYLINESV